MQSYLSLSYEPIKSRFCESGDFIEIPATGDFSYDSGLSNSFSNPGTYITRQHVNAIGRLGTSAQAVMQAGGLVGYREVPYGEMSVVVVDDGITVTSWRSLEDGNATAPLGVNGGFYEILDSTSVTDDFPEADPKWRLATPDVSSDFFNREM